MRTGKRVGAALALTVFTLAGCGSDASSDSSADVPTDATDEGMAAPDADDGDFTGGSDDLFGDIDIPGDIPLPEGHDILQSIGNPEAGYTIILNAPMAFGQVADFYERELPAAGWESVVRKDASGVDVVSIEADRAADDHSVLVQISSDGAGTSVTIFTGPPGG